MRASCLPKCMRAFFAEHSGAARGAARRHPTTMSAPARGHLAREKHGQDGHATRVCGTRALQRCSSLVLFHPSHFILIFASDLLVVARPGNSGGRTFRSDKSNKLADRLQPLKRKIPAGACNVGAEAPPSW